MADATAADAPVDFVKYQRVGPAPLRQRNLEGQDETGQFASAGDLYQGSERRAGIGGNLELDAIHALRAPLRFVERGDGGAEARRVEL